MFKVTCLDDGRNYYFDAMTPYDAMCKMLYTLNLSNNMHDVTINKTESGKHLWLEHAGKTYVTPIE